MSIAQYVPLKVVGTWAPANLGTIDILEGKILDGDFFSEARDNPVWSREATQSGPATRVKNDNRGGRVEVTLSASDPTNDLLSAAAKADLVSENVVGALVLRDLSGTSAVLCTGAFLVDIPAVVRGNSRGTVTWTWECASIDPFVGGHNIVG